MIGRRKKIRSFLAITVSAAMIIRAMPELKIVSHAAKTEETVTEETMAEETVAVSGGEETVPAVSGGDEAVPVVSGGDATVPVVSGGDATVPVISGGDAEPPKVSEPPTETVPTVSGGDAAWDIEEYQSKKLKIKALKTTVFAGESHVTAAKIGYERTTSDEGYGYRVSKITMNGVDLTSYRTIACDTSDSKQLKISVYDDTTPGKYVITLLPIVPRGIHADSATLTIHVVPSIYSITMDTRNMVVYKAAGKTAAFQLKPIVKAYKNGYTVYKPKALKWSALYYDSAVGDYVSYEGRDITISSAGRVTISKNWDGEKYPKLKIVCQANDYEGNTASDECLVELYASLPADGTAVITSSTDIFAFQNGDEVTAASLQGMYFRVSTTPFVKGEKATVQDKKFYTYKSSSKDVSINKYGMITVHSVSGKPVTLTATSLDGKNKKSLTLKLKKKIFALDELKIEVHGGSQEVITNSPDNILWYSGNGNDVLRLSFEATSGKDYYDLKVSIKGGKNVTSNYNKLIAAQEQYLGYGSPETYTQDLYIIPTAQVVEVTIKSGAESRVYKIMNIYYTTKKNTPLKGEPKITTSVSLYTINDTQTIRLYVGKQNAGGLVEMSIDRSFHMANYGNTLAEKALTASGITTTTRKQIDEDGYITFTVRGFALQYKSEESTAKLYKGIKFPNTLKYQLTVCDKVGNYYMPSPLTVKIVNSLPKTEYKLKTSYKITKQPTTLELEDTEWNSYGDYYYYQQLTYSGSRKPEDTIQILDFNMELGKDLLEKSELAQRMDICKDADANYYFGVNDDWAYDILKEANSKIFAEGKDVTKYGRDAKLDGYVYITYRITTKEGYEFMKEDKVKVSIVISKTDWERLENS